MKKYIVLSVNDNPDYLYFLPLTVWAWRKFGWETILMYYGDWGKLSGLPMHGKSFEVCHVSPIEGYRSDTITQISRLYAASRFFSETYLMTGDIDMLPLADYWKVTNDKPTVWGHDLTGYTHYPICYIGMSNRFWCDAMKIYNPYSPEVYIRRDLDTLPQAKNPDFYKYWFTDQDLITQRLKPYKPTIINRGQYPNEYARGRVDRGAWTLEHKEMIDAHLHHQIHHKGNEWKFTQTMELLQKVWPEENFDWYIEYHNEFKRLTGHA